MLCPAFPELAVIAGTYVEGASKVDSKTQAEMILDDRNERFHVLQSEAPLLQETLILDFKLTIGVAPDYLERWIRNHKESRVARLVPPYRDHLTQRFSNYFVRIALPP